MGVKLGYRKTIRGRKPKRIITYRTTYKYSEDNGTPKITGTRTVTYTNVGEENVESS
mgnify:CR=1 FL=1